MAFAPITCKVMSTDGLVTARQAEIGYGNKSKWGTVVNHTLSHDWSAFLELNGLPANNNSAVLFVMYWKLQEYGDAGGAQLEYDDDGEALRGTTDLCCRVDGVGGVPANAEQAGVHFFIGAANAAGAITYYWKGTGPGPTALHNNLSPDLFRKIVGSVGNAWKWILDLCACMQTKSLNVANIRNYFSYAIEEEVGDQAILNFISAASARLPTIMDTDDLRELVVTDTNTFVKYHTQASSTAGLAMQMLSEFRPLCELMFSPLAIQRIHDANENFWSKVMTDRISPMVRCATLAFVNALNLGITNWHQGNRARASHPTHYTRFHTIFLRANELKFAEANYRGADSMEGLLNTVRLGFAAQLD